MKINKYLKELGLEQEDMPGYYDPKLELDRPAGDQRNEEDEEGFCEYEFFSLDYTLSLYIYSKLCYFREYIPIGTPGSLCSFHTNDLSLEEQKKASKIAHDKWLSMIDKMILAFKLKITGVREGYEGVDREAIREGMQLFIEYYDCLWF